VLVTPALLRRLEGESIADKELSVLLALDQLVPNVISRTKSGASVTFLKGPFVEHLRDATEREG